jgi:hypothetical protein
MLGSNSGFVVVRKKREGRASSLRLGRSDLESRLMHGCMDGGNLRTIDDEGRSVH